MYENEHKKIELLKEGIARIEAKCQEEGRQPLEIERNLINDMRAEADHIEKSLPERAMTVPQNGLIGAGGYGGGGYSGGIDVNNEPRAVKDKSFRSMFYGSRSAKLDTGGFEDDTEFFNVILSNRFDPRLPPLQKQIFDAQTEGTHSTGGFSVPEELSSRWLDASLENEITRRHCQVFPMKSESLLVPAWDAKDFSSGAYAGLTMTFSGEGSEASKQTAKMRQIQLTAKVGQIYVDASLELVGDGKGFADQLRQAMIKAIGFGIDRHCIGSAGTGAGVPQSIQNAPCKIEISGETGQNSGTIVYGNLKKAYARQLNPDKAMWLFNHQAIPDLLELSIAIGVGGDHVPVLNQSGDGRFTILGRPAIPTSHLPAIGSANCIMFINWDYYTLAMRQEVVFDTTDSHRWLTRERSYRVLIRFDGQATLDAEITPENGATLSPIVGLAAI